MKVFRYIYIFGIVLISQPTVVLAKAEKHPYAVLDMQFVMTNSKAYKNLQTTIESKRLVLAKESQQREKQIHQQKEELEKKRHLLSQADFEKKSQAIQKNLEQFGHKYYQQHSHLHHFGEMAMQQIHSAISSIAKDIAKHNNYTLVFHKEALVYSDPADDLSKQVLVDLDRKLPVCSVEPQAGSS